MGAALRYLQQEEWSMGNGQCPSCCGCQPERHFQYTHLGHKIDCELALAIEELGGRVAFQKKAMAVSEPERIETGPGFTYLAHSNAKLARDVKRLRDAITPIFDETFHEMAVKAQQIGVLGAAISMTIEQVLTVLAALKDTEQPRHQNKTQVDNMKVSVY